MADANTTSVDLDPTEVALIIGEEDGSMTIRVVPAQELPDGTTDVPEPHEIAIALAMRLLNDPDFHDSVLEWYENQDEEEDTDEDELVVDDDGERVVDDDDGERAVDDDDGERAVDDDDGEDGKAKPKS